MDPGAPQRLVELYRRAVYRARDASGAWHAFTFESPGATPDEAIRLPFEPPWALVTACNPMSVRRPDCDNAAAMARLRDAVQALRLRSHPAEGHDPLDRSAWREESLVVEGLEMGRAAHLMRVFRQHACVYVAAGTAGVLFADPELWERMPLRVLESGARAV